MRNVPRPPFSPRHPETLPRRLAWLALAALLVQACSCDAGSGDADDGDGRDAATLDGATGPDASTNEDADIARPDVPPTPPPDVHVLLTADNAYGFGYGSADAMTDYFMGIEDGADDIFVCSAACDDDTPCADGGECDLFGTCNGDRNGPETYIVPGEMADQEGYLYVITWSDEAVTQGLIGQFSAADGASSPVYTGSEAWEVCATGVDIDPVDEDPTVGDINAQIANCNMGDEGPTFSGGWIGNELGNNPKGVMELTVLTDPSTEPPQFNPLCQAEDDADPTRTGDSLDAAARWMWFDDDNSAAPTAFQSNGDPRGDFLIFRLPISEVVILI